MNRMSNPLRELPSVSEFLASEPGRRICAEFGEGLAKLEFRRLLDGVRECLRRGRCREVPPLNELCGMLRPRLARFGMLQGRRAINATGILLHTGLGRAPLCDEALENMRAGTGYSILQTDLDSGKRCLREQKIEAMLRELTGCEAATVVNNNAAATMLVLNTMASGREVVISRGQLIEIGGAYRMVDVMAMSGCVLREVGCTNRTHLRDYEAVINENTGALIHVHTSNYRVRGFAGTPDIRQLAGLGLKHDLPVVDDLGSGALVPLAKWGLPDEPLVPESVRAGAAVMCFSGDKLICGPQSGIIVGRREIVARIRRNPFARMFRVCKLTLAALETTLIHFINGTYEQALPFYRKLSLSVADIQQRAEDLAARLAGCDGFEIAVEPALAYVGSGSIPDQGIESRAVRITPRRMDVGEFARCLRLSMPSVFGRVQEGSLFLDLRSAEEDDELAAVVGRVMNEM